MNRKILILLLILSISVIGSGLFFYMKDEQVNKIELDEHYEKSKLILYKGNVKTTIRPATKEEIIEDFMQAELLTYEEAEELYEKERKINSSGYDEKIKTAILQNTHYYDSIGIRFNAVIKYIYSLEKNEPISIDYIGNIWTDAVGEVNLVAFRSTESPRIDYNYYRLEVSHFGDPLIEVDNDIANTLITKYNFVNKFGKDFNLRTQALEPQEPMPLKIKATLEDLI